ncbi:unnamed protein product [Cyprideis torosa]|uniref:Uncharacterized protein n=1 Tax=Cyprideis torosa TaxID=163714 RepID=A0A7R8ZNY4_9CRUS|nr:unnamed protein product [Cyprideis torosa]CAG0887422.1 unnamed protein product [Cyprideis torosa]
MSPSPDEVLHRCKEYFYTELESLMQRSQDVELLESIKTVFAQALVILSEELLSFLTHKEETETLEPQVFADDRTPEDKVQDEESDGVKETIIGTDVSLMASQKSLMSLQKSLMSPQESLISPQKSLMSPQGLDRSDVLDPFIQSGVLTITKVVRGEAKPAERNVANGTRRKVLLNASSPASKLTMGYRKRLLEAMPLRKKRTGPPSTVCSSCGKALSSITSLKHHVERMHGSPELVVCSVCGKSISKLNIRTHMNQVHSGIHACPFCPDKKYNNKFTLKKHIMFIHEGDGFVCTECGRRFNSASKLREHELRHIGKRPFACNQCDQSYYSQSKLNRHVNFEHLNLRPYQCDECPNAYRSKKCLDDHKNKHLGIKPHVCSYCNSAFAFRGALFTHTKLMHKKVTGLHSD